MRIAVVSASQVPSITANSIQVMKVAQALAELGHTVTLLVPGQLEPAGGANPPWDELAAHYGLRQTAGGKRAFAIQWLPAYPRLKRYDFAWQALRRARRMGYEVIYTWMLQAAVFGLYQGFPVLLEMHDRPSGRIGPLFFREFWRKPGQKRMLPITRALTRILEHDHGLAFPPGQVAVSPDGVDLERYADLPPAEEARRRLGLPAGLTVGYSGHFYPGRGMDLLYQLTRQKPDVRFLWVGGRPEDVESWRARLQADGLQNAVLTGFVSNQDLPLYQAAADILLMPYGKTISGSSGGNIADVYSPMKMFEYMAAGRAILTSDLPVLREVLHERNAAFCPPEDPDAWLAGLDRLAGDADLRASLGCQARLDVEQYTWRARAGRALAGWEDSSDG
jgi:glycosyltransferase involved in cell wall biosynthesis